MKVFFILICLTQFLLSQLHLDRFELAHINIVDVESGKLLKNHFMLVENDRIKSISNSPIESDSLHRINLQGKFVLAGLIDSHVHFATDPTTVDSRERTETVLKNMLLSGITTVRDMAGDTRALADLSRDALVGDIPSPLIYYSSLMAGPQFFADPRTKSSAAGLVSGQTSFMRAMTDQSNIPLMVAEAKGTGATGLKLYANLSADLMQRITSEAHNQKMIVWAHSALPPTSPDQVLASGADVISHAARLVLNELDSIPKVWLQKHSSEYWDKEYAQLDFDDLFDQMKRQNTILDATIILYKRLMNKYKDNAKIANRYYWRYEIGKRVTAAAHEAGVIVIAGTDTDQELFVQEEMKLFVNEMGFTIQDALRAATLDAAKALGKEKLLGSIETGKLANLSIFDQNPLENIDHIDHIHMVIKQGKIYNGKRVN